MKSNGDEGNGILAGDAHYKRSVRLTAEHCVASRLFRVP
jgi:hypothetical protein